jgi:hypothetical protein
MADLQTGQTRPTRDWLHELLEVIGPWAHERPSHAAATPLPDRAQPGAIMAHARSLIEAGGAHAQRAAAERGGVQGATQWLADCFLVPSDG